MANDPNIIERIMHIGSGHFSLLMEDSSIKNAGPNLCGMIRYVYFEDYSMPEIGWTVDHKKLLADYQSKVLPDIKSGKIKPGKHEFNTDFRNN